jgi:hypothetical protein
MGEWRKRNKKQVANIMRKRHYQKRYGCTIDDYNRQLDLQNGECAICGRCDNYPDNYFCIDHNHYTGKMRGLVCTACNYLIGQVENNLVISGKKFEKVQNYLAFYVDLPII